jgi:hypothetical protein
VQNRQNSQARLSGIKVNKNNFIGLSYEVMQQQKHGVYLIISKTVRLREKVH